MLRFRLNLTFCLLFLCGGASAQPTTPTPAAPSSPAATPSDTAILAGAPVAPIQPTIPPPPGQSVRIGGDRQAKIAKESDRITMGTAEISTPLPEGYPLPTPPDAIDLKTYPSVRRAEFSSDGSNPDIGMNMGFFPLFNHIKRRDIAMTSPVEMDYRGMSKPAAATGQPSEPAEGAQTAQPAQPAQVTEPNATNQATEKLAPAAAAPTGWTMSFLYRTPELGEAGNDGKDKRIKIVDSAPRTYIAIGLQGGYTSKRVRAGMAKLDEWLASQSVWQVDGDVRALYYNGPEKRDRDKWLEVQLPVKLVGAKATSSAISPLNPLEKPKSEAGGSK